MNELEKDLTRFAAIVREYARRADPKTTRVYWAACDLLRDEIGEERFEAARDEYDEWQFRACEAQEDRWIESHYR